MKPLDGSNLAYDGNSNKWVKLEAALNELYHDRARLERVVKDAAHLLAKVITYAERYHWVDDDGESVVNDYPVMGSLEQFADTHKE